MLQDSPGTHCCTWFWRPFIFGAPTVWGHKTFMCHLPYLLLIHIGEIFANCFLQFFARIFVGMIQALLNVLGSSRVSLALLATLARSIKKFKFLVASFFLHSLLDDFVGIIIVQSLKFFHCSNHFGFDSGFGAHFNFVIGNVFDVIFNVSVSDGINI